MKKKEIEMLDKLNSEKKLTSDMKNIIKEKIINIYFISIDILLLFIILIIAANKLPKETALIIYKISSTVFLIFAFILFELSYKKDNDGIAISGIEILFLSIIILLSPYFFIEKPKIITRIVGVYFSVYYILKSLYIYKLQRKKYLKSKSDISQIIKKECQDELAKLEKEKINNTGILKKRRGRPKKISYNRKV